MEITASRNEGLEREWKVRVPAEELSKRLEARLQELQPRAKLKGFRPGKVPVSHLRRLYGKSLMSEVIDGVMEETGKRILEEAGLRPAMRPRIELETDEMEGGLEAVQNGKGALAYKMSLEVVPEIKLQDFTTLELTRKVAKVREEDIESALEKIARRHRTFKTCEDENATAREGDRVRLDFVGRIDGKPFENGEGKDVLVEIPAEENAGGFEKKLQGRKVGKSEMNVTFPEDYHEEALAGQEASFDVDIKEIAQPQEVTIDDNLAASMGEENLEALRKRVSDMLAAEYIRMTRAKLKRQLLDRLAEQYSFELPSGMVKQELQSIAAQVSPPTQEGKNETPDEEELKREYGDIAERRVRLALVLNEIGQRNNVEVTSQELSHAIALQAQKFPGDEQKLYAYYREHPEAIERLRAPIFEDKVIDFLFELAKIEEQEISREELYRDEDEDEG
ncbi:MAG: trigger factor [Hyphomicrobiales bacterium]|nr:trigger factor [Hyphomicrobiales bacterium]